MDFIYSFIPASILTQIFVGLSRTVILFIVTAGLSLILGVLRIPNVFHGSLYMIGAFMAYTITNTCRGRIYGFYTGPYRRSSGGCPFESCRGTGSFPVSL